LHQGVDGCSGVDLDRGCRPEQGLDGGEVRQDRRTFQTQSLSPLAIAAQRLHWSVSVSTVRCPRRARTSSALDLPVPDIPVTRIFAIR
jgi:hypothetical protein